MRPSAAVITNVEADHLEYHGDLEGIFRAFEPFVDRVDAGGLLLICADDPGARRIADYARATGHRVLHLRLGARGRRPGHRHRRAADGVEFVGRPAARASRRPRSGRRPDRRHMALNATAALALAAELGLDLDTVVAAWAGFGGVHRRFEYHGDAAGVRVYDDYAHHPTEVAATARRPARSRATAG